MTDIRILQTLDREMAHYTSAILVARNETESDLYRSCLSVVQRIVSIVRDVDATEADEERYAIDLAVERLRKASAKATQPHVRDQIRLACRQLNAVRQPAPAETEPIDIFDI